VRGALLVAGTGSDAGKSALVAGLCRWLARQGVSVAPFKAQNMSLNSFVTAEGAEIGRAQAMQAAAAGIEPTADMNLARAAGLPVVVVGDIDRGGVFAAMFGTLALLSPQDQALIAGFVINKFRGAPELLDSGLSLLHRLTGRPVYGVLPWRDGLWLDAEDSLSLGLDRGTHHAAFGTKDFLRVAVVKL